VPRRKERGESLRSQLLRSAVAVLEQDGPAALRARHVAATAGTSTAALYELFGDKAGLVRAIFFEGFRSLLQDVEAVEETRNPRADLIGTLAASRSFAVRHPMLFEVMYSRPIQEFRPEGDDLAVTGTLYGLMLRRVSRWLPTGTPRSAAVDAAHAVIALNRGLIAAELAGLQGKSQASVDRRWSLAVNAQLDGLELAARRRS
jgi:AcrR family transcriptional regulator